jgi:hypothetical protein
MTSRRAFLQQLAASTGAVVLLPQVVACGSSVEPEPRPAPTPTGGGETVADPLAVPRTKPADWDAIAFNRARGNAGAIPESYLADVNGPDGELKHLGKHLPYVPNLDSTVVTVPGGALALMWGDDTRSYPRHPAVAGHWYDWVRVRRATDDDAEEIESRFAGWPEVGEGQQPYLVSDGGDLATDGGKNTVYVVQLPPGVGPGDTVRVIGHCTLHGEYVDFLVVPALA